jgi:hypothetical protein
MRRLLLAAEAITRVYFTQTGDPGPAVEVKVKVRPAVAPLRKKAKSTTN